MCDCADELERKLRLQAAGGELWNEDGAGGKGGRRAGAGGEGRWPGRCGWSGLLGGALVFFSIFGIFYKYFELGILWRKWMKSVWKAFLSATCDGDVTSLGHGGHGGGGVCGTRLFDSKRRYPEEKNKQSFRPKDFRIPGFSSGGGCNHEEDPAESFGV